jgi:Tfp pilus assembly protein PilF
MISPLLWLGLLLTACGGGPAELTPQQRQARQLSSQGVVAMDQHNYVRGRESFGAAIHLDPAYATAHANLGISFYSLGQYDSARVALEEALRLQPEHLHAAYTMGLILQAQGRDHERALQLFHRVADTDPDDPHVRYYLGRTWAKLDQPDSAMAAYRRVIELDGTNVSAWYAMAQAQRQTGDMEAWRATLETFNRLSQSGLEGVSSAYQGQGKYAEAVSDTPFGGNVGGLDAPTFESAPPPAGLPLRSPFLTVVDADEDGRLDLLAGVDGGAALLHNAGPGFRRTDDWTFPPGDIASLTLADIDDDGDADAAIGAPGGTRILRNDDGAFVSTGEPGMCATIVFGDADHDGDADAACVGPDLRLWSNDGTGLFEDVSPRAGLDAASARHVVFTDADADRDVDLLAAGSTLALYSNNRDGTFSDVAAERGLTADGVTALAVADLVPDGWMDVAVIGASGGRLVRGEGRGYTSSPLDLPAAQSLAAADLDNDGDLDLVAWGGDGLHTVTTGVDGFSAPSRQLSDPISVAAMLDIDEDGRLDIVTPAATLYNRTPAGRHLRIDLTGLNSNPDGFGARVEVKTAGTRQVREFRGGPLDAPSLHIGLGDDEAEFVRVLWPSGVRQTEGDVAGSDTLRITEVNRKGTSCPILYAWDGERYRFVSDFLGGGIIGYFVGRDADGVGQYYMPDNDEYLPIPHLQPTAEGRFVLQVGNQLEEVIYLDQAQLVAVDHPAGTQMHPEERLLSAPPYPAFRAVVVEETRPLRGAVTGNGTDVTATLARIDDDWVDDIERLDVHGYARRHELVLDLGDLAGWEAPVLLGHGWVDYAHSTSHWAAAERGWSLTPPRLEARHDGGAWRLVSDDMGVPAGLPKGMLVDLAGHFPANARDAQLRITTNMKVYWDRFVLGRPDREATPLVHRLPLAGDLHWRGYPAHESIHGTFAYRYDYDDVRTDAGWGAHGGAFTRYGEVGELVGEADDRFVIMFHGDELTLSTEAGQLPAVPEGFERSYLFYANGFGKDMDLHSAHSLTVGPLPYQGMSRYPYGPGDAYPQTAEHIDYQLEWNTRRIRGSYR